MNPRLIFSLIILLSALSLSVFAQESNGGVLVPFSQAPYEIGEHLTYDVSFSNFTSVAHVEFQVMGRELLGGRDLIELHAHAQTIGVVNVALLSINNEYTTYVDPASGLPFRSKEVIRDATRSDDLTVDFNQSAGTDAIPSKQNSFPGTYDYLSAFYRVRALPLREGEVYRLTVHGHSHDYQLEIKVVGKQVVKSYVGSFNTIIAQVKVSGDSPVKNAKVYFSDDERHVPVRITGRVSTGELTVELAGSDFVRPAPAASPTPAPPIAAVKPTPVPKNKPTPVQTAGPTDWPFDVGEQLNYQVFLGTSATPVGVATYQVRGRSRYFEQDGLYLTVRAQTTGAASRIFVANDAIESYVNPKSLLPYRTVMQLLEGKRKENQTLTLNQDSGTATIDNGKKIDIPTGTHDYLSLFYVIRTFNLTPPKRSAISLLVEGKPKTVFVTAIKKETIALGQQKVSATAVSLTTDDPESDKYQIRIWISTDRRRLPLRIVCQTELGSVKADLAIVPTSSQ